jgi:hypothetical protein
VRISRPSPRAAQRQRQIWAQQRRNHHCADDHRDVVLRKTDGGNDGRERNQKQKLAIQLRAAGDLIEQRLPAYDNRIDSFRRGQGSLHSQHDDPGRCLGAAQCLATIQDRLDRGIVGEQSDADPFPGLIHAGLPEYLDFEFFGSRS